MLRNVLHILITGAGILGVAMILNLLATKLHIATWYDFVKEPKNTSMLSYVWLFLIYPFGLGGAAYLIVTRLLKHF